MRQEQKARKLPKNWSGPGRVALQAVLGEEFGPYPQGLSAEQMARQLRRRGPWSEKAVQPYAFFCPLCRVERKTPQHPNPWNARHLLQVGLLTAVFTLATSPWLELKGWVSFVPFWMVFEAVYRLRVRAQLRCDQCGFDPILYLTDVKRARQEVESHWRQVFEKKGIPYPRDAAAEKARGERNPGRSDAVLAADSEN